MIKNILKFSIAFFLVQVVLLGIDIAMTPNEIVITNRHAFANHNYVIPVHVELEKKVDMKTEVLAMVTEAGIDSVKADRVIRCESTWNPKAVNLNRNGSNDKGLWQLNSVHGLSDEIRLDPIKSTAEAIKLIKQKGFQPWVCQ